MTGTAVEEVKAIVLAGAGELLGEDSPYERGRRALRREYEPILLASAAVTKIESAEDAEKAVEFGRLLQNGTKEMERYFKDIKLQIDAIKKPVLDAEKADGGPLEVEKRRLGVMLTTYREKVERERLKAEAEARAVAEAEMKAERERLAQEARDEQIERALAAEESGDGAQATAILEEATVIDEPVAAPPTIIQAAAPTRFAGSTGKTTYSAKVNDLMALVKAIAEGKAPLQAVMANESFINAQARAYKEGFSLAGCSLDRSTGTSFRR
jgi:hypothetical protein